ncbi:MAG: uroporphyrinogen decarboxylase family protein [Sphaerochaetaceae bacterium]|jgi:hypothetical protein|nr:hypothetical protein [Sphaerochaetaceae bacterium]NLO59907.1 hypothetical protein [Spirochaetales bacterium]MDD2406996.1 uroporphyrinogen decarboxylase family protein [Sphaerochaetaceae bacterium]MDD4260439.1 uroporphyrinogen decarboxylase family protein [Sphaerochaetaceae bacterium]MDD4763036.1 uroporphyrinogen decarboxylase family protein [Sphaerochaetaceae bacterium]
MLDRKTFFDTLKGISKSPQSWTMSFYNEKIAKTLLGADAIPSDITPPKEFTYGGSDPKDWEVKAKFAERGGMAAVPVGYGANMSFGHGGPGEFAEKTIESSENVRITQYETGVYKKVCYDPHFYHYYDYPIQSPEEFNRSILPDPDDPLRYKNLKEEVEYHKNRDRVTFTNLMGFFASIHYFIYQFDLFLMDLILKPEETMHIIECVGQYNLRVASHLLEAGVDVICFCDDLGSENSLLISPVLCKSIFIPWHKKLADLCHSHGAILHMHSHGNINPIMNDLYACGIDILNPLDPNEGMDMATLSRQYGDRLTFAGGLDKFFFNWDTEHQREALRSLASAMNKGYFFMDSGGIPENVTVEQWEAFKELKAELIQQ